MAWTRGELLGEGAYGRVYAGLNQKTGELMAVKVLDLMDRRGNHMQTQLAELQQVRDKIVVRYAGQDLYCLKDKLCITCMAEGVQILDLDLLLKSPPCEGSSQTL